ncbi:MAG TPA: substrate-binding domain-containing protein [Acidimicrobiia bacterium]|nr:substrate-binding domain-containing protein [Acidimicrobiia bacterium]
MSGWRAGLVALALGGVILAIGWVIGRDDPAPSPGTSAPVVDADLTLACTQSFSLVCTELANRFGFASTGYTLGSEIGADTIVIGFAGDLPAEASAFARSPMAIAVWAEKAPRLQQACGEVNPACLVDQAGTRWEDLGGSPGWGTLRLGLADPETGIADLEAWKLIATEEPTNGFRQFVPLTSQEGGGLMRDLVLFPSRADAVVASEVAIASQLANARARAGRLQVFYPEPTPYLQVAAIGEGRTAGSFIETLMDPEIQALLGSLGLRPLTGETADLLEDLGQPGTEAAGAAESERPALVASWDTLIGA